MDYRFPPRFDFFALSPLNRSSIRTPAARAIASAVATCGLHLSPDSIRDSACWGIPAILANSTWLRCSFFLAAITFCGSIGIGRKIVSAGRMSSILHPSGCFTNATE